MRLKLVDRVGTNLRPIDLVGDVAHEHLVAGVQAAGRRHEVGRRAADPGSLRQLPQQSPRRRRPEGRGPRR